MWSAYILPYMEDKALRDIMTFQEGGGVNHQWAHPGPYRPEQIRRYPYENVQACETVIGVYRCPSAGLPDHQYDISSDNWHVMNRVPTSYLGVASGIVVNQNAPRAMIELDGVMFGLRNAEDDGIKLKKVTDGTSKTFVVAEALHDRAEQERIGGRQRENRLGDHKDHWAIGSDDVDIHMMAQRRWDPPACPSTCHNSSLARTPAAIHRILIARSYNCPSVVPIRAGAWELTSMVPWSSSLTISMKQRGRPREAEQVKNWLVAAGGSYSPTQGRRPTAREV